MKTEPWWVCGTCKKPVVKPGKGAREKMLDHRKKCGPTAGFGIQQVRQGAKR